VTSLFYLLPKLLTVLRFVLELNASVSIKQHPKMPEAHGIKDFPSCIFSTSLLMLITVEAFRSIFPVEIIAVR